MLRNFALVLCIGLVAAKIKVRSIDPQQDQAVVSYGDDETTEAPEKYEPVFVFSQLFVDLVPGPGGANVVVAYWVHCVDQNCSNTICYDQRCINATQPLRLMQKDNCTIVVCNSTCDGFYMNTDNCPVCKCNGEALRDICNTTSPCTEGTCQDNVCHLTGISAQLPKACISAYQCDTTEDCVEDTCVASNNVHLNYSCLYDNMCPNGYYCGNNTCWQGGKDHLEGFECVFDFQCPSNYTCEDATCYAGGEQHSEYPCLFTRQCQEGEVCRRFACRQA